MPSPNHPAAGGRRGPRAAEGLGWAAAGPEASSGAAHGARTGAPRRYRREMGSTSRCTGCVRPLPQLTGVGSERPWHGVPVPGEALAAGSASAPRSPPCGGAPGASGTAGHARPRGRGPVSPRRSRTHLRAAAPRTPRRRRACARRFPARPRLPQAGRAGEAPPRDGWSSARPAGTDTRTDARTRTPVTNGPAVCGDSRVAVGTRPHGPVRTGGGSRSGTARGGAERLRPETRGPVTAQR